MNSIKTLYGYHYPLQAKVHKRKKCLHVHVVIKSYLGE